MGPPLQERHAAPEMATRPASIGRKAGEPDVGPVGAALLRHEDLDLAMPADRACRFLVALQPARQRVGRGLAVEPPSASLSA